MPEKEKKQLTKKPDKKKDNKNPKKKKGINYNIFWIYGIIVVAILALQFWDFGAKPETVYWNDLSKMIKEKEVLKITVINKEKAEVTLKPEVFNQKKYDKLSEKKMDEEGPHFLFRISSPEVFHKQLQDIQKDLAEEDVIFYASETRKDFSGEILSWIIPIGILIVIWVFVFRRMGGGGGAMGGGIFNMGKSKAKMFNNDAAIKTSFKDVAGLEEAKQEITEIVDFLKNKDKYTRLGGKIPKGALLVGPPGTGKTLLAKAVAGEAEVPFFSMSGSDFVEMFVGVGASRVRDLFSQAKAKAPCIIFIDEIDAIGRSRSSKSNFNSNDERESTLNQLLTEMDGFDTNTGVIIIAATNRAEILDNALLRAGRFDRQILLELPDLNEREEIFEVHLKPIKTNENLNMKSLARQTPGFSGADIANVCNEAALIAARGDKEFVGKQDFVDAIDRIVGGLEKRKKIITPQERKTIAYHEAGHATVSWLLEHSQPLIKVTIVPRGKALGAAWYLPEERQLTTKEQILDEICAALGGRAAEEVIFNKISSGALNDLERVTKQAYSMVSFMGMSEEVGNISFYDSSGQEYSFQKPYSEKTAELIDQEVKKIIDKEYMRAKNTIINNIVKFKELAERLQQKEVIFTDDVEDILGKRTFLNPHTEEAINGIRQDQLDIKKEKKMQEKKQAETSTKENKEIR